MHYLKAIEAIGTDEAPKVMAQMRATPINEVLRLPLPAPRERERKARRDRLVSPRI